MEALEEGKEVAEAQAGGEGAQAEERVQGDVLAEEPHSNPSAGAAEKVNVAAEICFAETTPRRDIITTTESTIIGTPLGIEPAAVAAQPGMVAG